MQNTYSNNIKSRKENEPIHIVLSEERILLGEKGSDFLRQILHVSQALNEQRLYYY